MFKKLKRISYDYMDNNQYEIRVYDDTFKWHALVKEDFETLQNKVKKIRDLENKTIYLDKGLSFPREKLKGLIKVTKDPLKADYTVINFKEFNRGFFICYLQNDIIYINHVGQWCLRQKLKTSSNQITPNTHGIIEDKDIIKYYQQEGIFDNTEVEITQAMSICNDELEILKLIQDSDKIIDISVLRSYVENKNEDLTMEMFENIDGLLRQYDTVKLGLNALNLINVEKYKVSVYYLLSKNYFTLSKQGTRFGIYKNIIEILKVDVYDTINYRWMVKNAISEFDKEIAKKAYITYIENELKRIIKIEEESLDIIDCKLDFKIVNNG
jgi:hypothetical protein